jgi:hypothetical protein
MHGRNRNRSERKKFENKTFNPAIAIPCLPACLYQHSVCPFRRGMSLPTQPTSPSTRSVMQLRQHNNSTTTTTTTPAQQQQQKLTKLSSNSKTYQIIIMIF